MYNIVGIVRIEVVGFINCFVCTDVVVGGGKVVVTWMELPLTGFLVLVSGIYQCQVSFPGLVW